MFPLLSSRTDFAEGSRIWVYVTDRPLRPSEVEQVQAESEAFCRTWTAHNQALRAGAEVLGDSVLLLCVDETRAGASGCSIDKSVHFLEKMGAAMGVDFFERMRFAWKNEDGAVHWADRAELQKSVAAGHVHAGTLMFNSLVQRKSELAGKLWQPYPDSWHQRLVG
jgi:hypothetical protein